MGKFGLKGISSDEKIVRTGTIVEEEEVQDRLKFLTSIGRMELCNSLKVLSNIFQGI